MTIPGAIAGYWRHWHWQRHLTIDQGWVELWKYIAVFWIMKRGQSLFFWYSNWLPTAPFKSHVSMLQCLAMERPTLTIRCLAMVAHWPFSTPGICPTRHSVTRLNNHSVCELGKYLNMWKELSIWLDEYCAWPLLKFIFRKKKNMQMLRWCKEPWPFLSNNKGSQNKVRHLFWKVEGRYLQFRKLGRPKVFT